MRKILLLWTLCAVFAQHDLFSQGKVNVDSLVNVLNKYPKEDTVKVKMLLDLASEYQKSDTKKAKEYAETATKISEQLQYDFWLGKSYFAQSDVLYRTGDLEDAKHYCQKAISLFEKSNKYPNEIGSCITSLGLIAVQGGDFMAALKYYKSALSIFETTQNIKMQVKVTVATGIANFFLGDYEKALALYKKVITKSESLNDSLTLRSLYSNTALAYYRLGNYTLGLEYSFKAMRVAERAGNLQGLAAECNNLGNVYIDLNDKTEARKYYLKALPLYRKLNNKVGTANTMINITLTYDDSTAVEELKKTLEYCKEINNKRILAIAHQNLAYRLYNLEEYQSAYYHAQQGVEIEKTVQNNENTIKLNNNIVEILLDCSNEDLLSFGTEPNDRYKKAKAHLDTIFELGSDENPKYMMFAWQYLSKIQEKEQNYTQAYESYKKYVALKDSTSGDDIRNQITRKEIQYEFNKKETELKYQQQLTAEQLEKQKLLTFQQEQSLTLNQQTLTLKEQALMLSNKEKDLVHLAYLKEQVEKQEKVQELTLSQEREKGSALDLKLKNSELSAQQKQNLYLTSFAALQQKQKLYLIGFAALLLMGLGTLFYFYTTLKKQKNIIAQQNELNEHTITILSHDIKSPLIGVKLMLKKLNKDDPFVAQASQSLENQINAVNNILNNLLKMRKLALSKKDKNASANVNEIVQNVLQELSVAIQTKELNLQNELHEKVLLPIAPEKLQIILHNLLSNAVKYSFPHQSIRIFQEGKGICIQDFGVGLSPEQRSKLMREISDSKEGTNQERGNGLGLFIVGAMLQGEQIRVVFDAANTGGTLVRLLW